MIRNLVVLLLIAAGFLSRAASASPLLPGLAQEMGFLSVVMPDGSRARLETMITRPDRPGHFPLAVLIHGTSRVPADRETLTPLTLLNPSIAFATHGYAAVVVLRRGFGHSDHPFRETERGSCAARDYRHTGDISADDVLAAVAALRGTPAAYPWVDPDRVILAGISTGGFAVTAASARNPKGVLGVIDFAGGRGSRAENDVCDPDALVSAMRAWGETARVPALWMWAENDRYFAPKLGRRMFEAYVEGGAPANFHLNPAFGADGHALFPSAPTELWWGPVAEFLAARGLPTAQVITLPPMPPLRANFDLNPGCRANLERYGQLRTELKAFAVSSAGGHCQWREGRTTEEAAASALAACEALWATCRVAFDGSARAD
jgi:dienelactone hydrolase